VSRGILPEGPPCLPPAAPATPRHTRLQIGAAPHRGRSLAVPVIAPPAGFSPAVPPLGTAPARSARWARRPNEVFPWTGPHHPADAGADGGGRASPSASPSPQACGRGGRPTAPRSRLPCPPRRGRASPACSTSRPPAAPATPAGSGATPPSTSSTTPSRASSTPPNCARCEHQPRHRPTRLHEP